METSAAHTCIKGGRLNGMLGANEMSICKQDLILQEELNCETSIIVRETSVSC
jgi:hypothetical protein